MNFQDELTYEYSMRVLDAKGKLLVTERAVNLNRNYIYDLNNALAKSDEEASIKLQMIQLAVRQSMRRIGIKLKQITDSNSTPDLKDQDVDAIKAVDSVKPVDLPKSESAPAQN